MADQKDLERTYNMLDEGFRKALGEHADITGARFLGDFSLSLEQAQDAKFRYITKMLNLGKGDRFFEDGCGWGNTLLRAQQAGIHGIGTTPAMAQYLHCKNAGFDVFDRTWQSLEDSGIYPKDLKAIISIGSFEHYCSEDLYEEGGQELLYQRYFKYCAERLGETGKRMYLQTMSWPGKHPDLNRMRKGYSEPEDSMYRHLYYLMFFYPGSWLPKGLDQIEKTSSKYFKIIDSSKGQQDYVETMKRWGASGRKMINQNPGFKARIFWKALVDPFFRNQMKAFYQKSNQRCFERGWMHHERIVLELK